MAISPLHSEPIGLPGQSFINGRFAAGLSLRTVEHINPTTGAPQASIEVAGAEAVDQAVRAGQAAQRQWMALSPLERIQCFKRFGALLQAHEREFSVLGARESGIPAGLPLMGMALGWIDHYMGWIDKVEGQFTADAYPAPGFSYTRREPYGVIGVIIPWNGPLMATCMMAFPAIAAGNAVVLKPPTLSPFAPLRMAQLACEAGFPAGLFNVVPGDAEAGEALVAHPGVGKVTFTGGEGVARKVMAQAAEFLKPVAFELGGKSANLVFEDADLEAASIQAVYGALGLSGQGCVNPTRLLVHRSRYDEMVARAAGVAASIKVGDPLAPDTISGPVICQSACERIMGIIERSKSEGRMVCGGERLGGELAGGFFIQPTVFADLAPEASLSQNEVFGPVLAISAFDNDEQALAIANGTRYGLGAYLHTRDLDRAHFFAEQLQAGYVNINGFATMSPHAPFGGYKQSGFGRVGGWAGMEEYLQTKNVFIARRRTKA